MADKKTNKSFFSVSNSALLIAVAAGALALGFCASVFMPYSKDTASTVIEVPYGTGLKKISKLLHENKLIKYRFTFEAYAVITGKYKKLQAGEYEFTRRDSAASIASKMARGEVVSHEITVTEGLDVMDIAQLVQSRGIADGQEFIALCSDTAFLKSIGINYPNAEGFLFPDTYRFLKNEGARKVITTMYGKFREKSGLDPEKSYNIQGKNYKGYSVLKMASVIEKEAQAEAERNMVSSVFYNRLKSAEAYQRRLESCATVRYALNKKTGALSNKDIRVDSPYNTYIIIGLPPTPICNPGAKSIAAAIAPAKTDYYYFVVRGDGTHVFSRTLEEHNRAKSAYKHSRGK